MYCVFVAFAYSKLNYAIFIFIIITLCFLTAKADNKLMLTLTDICRQNVIIFHTNLG